MQQARQARWPVTGAAWIALCAAVVSVSAHPALASAGQRQPASFNDLFIPDGLGEVSHIVDSSRVATDRRQLILIQDAHANYDAQKNLAAILDRLVTDYGIRLVLVEGGHGDASLSYLRGRGTREGRRRLAEEWLKEGALSGEEYLDIVSDHDLALWGIDDLDLYEQAMSVFLDLEQHRPQLTHQLRALTQIVSQFRAQTLPESLSAFEAKQQAFDEDRLPLTDYLRYLVAEGDRQGVPASAFPTIARVLSAHDLKGTLDSDRIAAEQRVAVDWLRERADAEPLSALTREAERLRAGQTDRVHFYQMLDRLMQEAAFDRTPIPHLDAYIRYVTLAAGIESRRLMAEMAQAQARLKERLAASDPAPHLTSMADGLARFERLIALQWSPEDYAAYRAHHRAWRISQWLPRLRDEAERLGAAWTWSGDAEWLDDRLARAARFYDLAAARDESMVRRSLERMEAMGQQVAVLIVGGFHTDRMTQLLAEHGIQAAVITPSIGDLEEGRYHALLKARYLDRRVAVRAGADRPTSTQPLTARREAP